MLPGASLRDLEKLSRSATPDGLQVMPQLVADGNPQIAQALLPPRVRVDSTAVVEDLDVIKASRADR